MVSLSHDAFHGAHGQGQVRPRVEQRLNWRLMGALIANTAVWAGLWMVIAHHR